MIHWIWGGSFKTALPGLTLKMMSLAELTA